MQTTDDTAPNGTESKNTAKSEEVNVEPSAASANTLNQLEKLIECVYVIFCYILM